MKSKTPLISQTSLVRIIPFILLLIGSMEIFRRLGLDSVVGVIFALTLYFILRSTIPFSHRRGIKKMKKGDYEAAISDFKSSYTFFQKHKWLDKFRCIFILSPSAITYKEMALINIAFAYSQKGDGENSIKYYERALTEYPNSILAKTALNMINSTKDVQPPS